MLLFFITFEIVTAFRSNIKVLIVDDEVDVCQLLSANLQKFGIDAVYALSIQSAISQLKQDVYDLLFVDLNLSDGSGYDLLGFVKESGLEPKIVVISAYDSEQKKAISRGADFFIPKPFTKKEIMDVLRKLNMLN